MHVISCSGACSPISNLPSGNGNCSKAFRNYESAGNIVNLKVLQMEITHTY